MNDFDSVRWLLKHAEPNKATATTRQWHDQSTTCSIFPFKSNWIPTPICTQSLPYYFKRHKWTLQMNRPQLSIKNSCSYHLLLLEVQLRGPMLTSKLGAGLERSKRHKTEHSITRRVLTFDIWSNWEIGRIMIQGEAVHVMRLICYSLRNEFRRMFPECGVKGVRRWLVINVQGRRGRWLSYAVCRMSAARVFMLMKPRS